MATVAGQSRVHEAEAQRFSLTVMMHMLSVNVAAMIHLGAQLGLYRAMRSAGPVTAAQLAEATGANERFVLEWLRAQAAAEILDYAGDDRFELSDVQAAVLADQDSSFYRGGAFRTLPAMMARLDGVTESFKSGIGVSVGSLADPENADAVLAVFHRTMLVPVLLPALDGAVETLGSGGRLADIACGTGVALMEIARAYPQAQLHGYDLWTEGIAQARRWAEEQELTNITFHEARAEDLPDDGRFDLMCAFDCLHDMTQPAEALAAMRRALKADGTLVIGDFAGRPTFEENLETNRLLAAFLYSVSVRSCLQSSTSEPGGAGLGTLGFDEQTARRMTAEAGFTSFRVLDIEHPFNVFYEVRP